MLPAAHRLRRSTDFANAVRGGRKAGRGSVVVHLTRPADAGDTPAKAGFIVSKAVGGAVTRNKVKRRLRHLMAQRIERLSRGSVVVVRATPSAGLVQYPQMAHDLDLALEAVQVKRGAR